MTRKEILKVAKPILFNGDMVRAILDGRKTVTRRVVKTPTENVEKWFKQGILKPPYQPGDILYVRETWHKDINRFMYRADYGKNEKFYRNGKEVQIKWHPSIHMPKEAARILLKVKDVRVERLQEMSDNDCEKEGLENFCKKCSALFSDCDTCLNDGGIKEDFKELWNSTIKKSDLDRYGWDVNPWVWVIEFERIEVN